MEGNCQLLSHRSNKALKGNKGRDQRTSQDREMSLTSAENSLKTTIKSSSLRKLHPVDRRRMSESFSPRALPRVFREKRDFAVITHSTVIK